MRVAAKDPSAKVRDLLRRTLLKRNELYSHVTQRRRREMS